ncbi:transposase [Paracoccus aminophilus]|uniref:Transposase n=1 Tax=Paracoccus aminophilus JCM 7686 TaxID=1367847 RepID=S5Z0S2_PARAH|nr:transposase [Paracoccus aminophilus]AGT11036.1 transposase [Paracoccus aminophilus JCM 7686]
MKPKSFNTKSSVKPPAERAVKDIRRETRRHFSADDKIRIVLEGLRGDDSIAELYRKEGIAQSLYYTWSKEFMEAGNAGSPVTPPVPRPLVRSRTCAAKPVP